MISAENRFTGLTEKKQWLLDPLKHYKPRLHLRDFSSCEILIISGPLKPPQRSSYGLGSLNLVKWYPFEDKSRDIKVNKTQRSTMRPQATFSFFIFLQLFISSLSSSLIPPCPSFLLIPPSSSLLPPRHSFLLVTPSSLSLLPHCSLLVASSSSLSLPISCSYFLIAPSFSLFLPHLCSFLFFTHSSSSLLPRCC